MRNEVWKLTFEVEIFDSYGMEEWGAAFTGAIKLVR